MMAMSDVKLRKIVNLLSDPLQAHAAANLLTIEAKERGVLVADLMAEMLAPPAPPPPPGPPSFSDVGVGRRINREHYGLQAYILRETAKAWLVLGPEDGLELETWLPKSECEHHGEDAMGRAILTLPMWLARKKGFLEPV